MLHKEAIKRLEISSIIGIFAFIGYFFGDRITFLDKKMTAEVIKVYDGDTMTLQNGEDKLRVRFFGIDAPELKQEYGKESREHLLKMCPLGSKAELSIKETDKYNRLVAIINCNGYNLNKEQVAKGYAWAYTDYSFAYYTNQFNAKMKKLGLWEQDNPIEPKEWRRLQKKIKSEK